MALASESEVKLAYQGDTTAARYIDARFASELFRLLHDRQVAAVQRVMDQSRPARVLEIAPGPGRLTRDLRPPGPLVCLEYNEGMIVQGRPACRSHASWVRGNGFQLPLTPGFDLIYSFRFVRHFRAEDRARLYAEIRRVLNPGGFFLMDAVSERVSRPLREAHPDDYPIYDKLYCPEVLCAELTEAGLEPIALEPVQKFYRWQMRSQVLLGPRANWLNRLVIRGLERLPRREGLEWIVTCRRG
jgi:ubiquinone/menaquinone biosynthesis C-methylase UbiE